jgi:hypothetical protein
LDLNDQIQHAGLTHSTSYRFLKAGAIQPSSGESTENYLGTMTVEVQELMNEEISRRTVSHGQ